MRLSWGRSRPLTEAKRTILWIEDIPSSVADELDWCENQGLNVICVSSVHEFLQELEEHREHIGLVVVDLMLPGAIFGKHRTHNDRGFNAGWVLIETILRPMDAEGYQELPIMILTSRNLDGECQRRLAALNKRILNEAVRQVEFHEKHARMWKERFRKSVSEIFRYE
jgi:CheY-like chemotaxis protein